VRRRRAENDCTGFATAVRPSYERSTGDPPIMGEWGVEKHSHWRMSNYSSCKLVVYLFTLMRTACSKLHDRYGNGSRTRKVWIKLVALVREDGASEWYTVVGDTLPLLSLI